MMKTGCLWCILSDGGSVGRGGGVEGDSAEGEGGSLGLFVGGNS